MNFLDMRVVRQGEAPRLCGATILNGSRDCRKRSGSGVVLMKTSEDFVGRILQACVGLVQLAGRLRSELTQLVAVFHMGKRPKNQV